MRHPQNVYAAAVLFLALCVGGCAGSLSVLGPATTATALKTAKIALTAYNGLIQPSILAYGHWQTCGPTVVTKLCKPQATWDKVKSVEATATAAIVQLSPVLDGSVTDTGQVASAVDAVDAARTATINAYVTAGAASPLGAP